MCTALSLNYRRHYFGRNLDVEFSYGESVVVCPRKFDFKFKSDDISQRFAMIGAAHVADGHPLFYDAVNERGLCAAALNFPGYAKYHPEIKGAVNIAPFELIPAVLSSCADLGEARALLSRASVCDRDFSDVLKNTTLHWIISDRTGSVTVESVEDGLKIYDNPVGILTNSPPFPYQLFALNDYMSLSKDQPENTFDGRLGLKKYSRGMGALGLPGDLSSKSRFIRAAFIAANSLCDDESEEITQFFHILGGVEQQRGCVRLDDGSYEYTVYACCADTERGIYYYKTYYGTQICAVDMRRENLDGAKLAIYPMKNTDNIVRCN